MYRLLLPLNSQVLRFKKGHKKMNFWSFVLGIGGVCIAEFLYVRSAFIGGSATIRFLLKQKAYWTFFCIILAPLGGVVASILSAASNDSLVPIDWAMPSALVTVKSILFGTGFVALLSGSSFKDVKSLDINDISGSEEKLGMVSVLRWFFSR